MAIWTPSRRKSNGIVLRDQPHLHVRVGTAKRGEARQEPEVRKRQRRTDGDGSRQPVLAQFLDGLGDAVKTHGDRRRQHLPGAGQFDMAVRALEELAVQVSFQKAYLAADGGLRDPQFAGRKGEAAKPRRRLEGGERGDGRNAASERGHGGLSLERLADFLASDGLSGRDMLEVKRQIRDRLRHFGKTRGH
jgi:hypothetical protein